MCFFLISNKFCKFSSRLRCWAQKKIPFMWFEKLKQMCISSNGVKLWTSLLKFLQCCKILINLNLFRKILAEHESDDLNLHTDYYYSPLMCSFFTVCFISFFFSFRQKLNDFVNWFIPFFSLKMIFLNEPNCLFWKLTVETKRQSHKICFFLVPLWLGVRVKQMREHYRLPRLKKMNE